MAANGDFTYNCLLFFVLLILTLLLRLLFKSHGKVRHPPGPMALPLIGHLHLMTSQLPKSFQTLARRYGPLMKIRIGGLSFVVASNGAVATEILKLHDIDFASRFEFGPVNHNIYAGSGFITAPFGPYWRFMKKLCMTKLFAGSQLNRFNHIREEEITNLVKSAAKCGREAKDFDLSKASSTLMNNLICRMMMNKRCKHNVNEVTELRKMVEEMMKLSEKLGVYEVFGPLKKFDVFGHGRRLEMALWRYDAAMEEIIKFYEGIGNEEEDKDLMEIVLETYEDSNAEVRLTRNQIKFFFLELLMASIDTSAAALQWAMAELINHPPVLIKLRQEISSVIGPGPRPNRLIQESDVPKLPYLQAIVKETLRLHDPAPIIHRECIKDCKINGYDVKANTKVLINAYAIMRDPDTWSDPDEFIPDRFLVNSIKGQDYCYLPFGGGRRGCIGSVHALAVMHATIGALIQCFDWKVKDQEMVDINVGSGFSGAMARPLVCYPIPVTSFDPSEDCSKYAKN